MGALLHMLGDLLLPGLPLLFLYHLLPGLPLLGRLGSVPEKLCMSGVTSEINESAGRKQE